MKLFFEGLPYKTTLLTKWFKDTPFYIKRLKGQQGNSTLECVGYYYNASKGEHCFALPKVFFFNDKPFGTDGLEWKDGIDIQPSHRRDARLLDWKIDFLYELPLKLYSAIDIYSKKKDSKQVYQDSELLEVSSSRDKKNLSLLDITFALRDFYYEHEDLFVFIYKESHKGYNKVNWSRTVRKQTPFIDGDNIVYPVVNNRKKGVNYEEELLILFFNTLRCIDTSIAEIKLQDTEYELFTDMEFKRMMDNGVVVRNLMEIQENYYNETLVELWDLLYKFHSKSHFSGHGGKKKDDYLLVHKFNIVFENMIDELLNPYHEEEYQFAKQTEREKRQDDGKIIDHLFKYKSLVNEADNVYYIGDSKYYKDGATPEGPSLYKQYTYAKNIVQSQIDWFYAERPNFKRYIKYRDELTEGYTITPNFFITGNVEKESTWRDDGLKRTANPEHETDNSKSEFIEFERHYQFEDRLFDRDTLFLLQYDINFMFVLNAYVSKNQKMKKSFFDKAKELFKNDFTKYIADNYRFFVLKPTHEPKDIVLEKYFRKLIGKVFCPDDSNLVILALERDVTQINKQQELITNISTDFAIYPYTFGTEPQKSLRNILLPRTEYTIQNDLFDSLSLVSQEGHIDGNKVINSDEEEYALVGYYKGESHLKWIIENGIYNTRISSPTVKLPLPAIKAKYLLLHNGRLGNKVFEIKSIVPYLMSREELPTSEDYRPTSVNYYMIYDIDTKQESNQVPKELLETNYFARKARRNIPVAIKMSDLRRVINDKPSTTTLKAYLDNNENMILGMVAEDEEEY